MRSLLRNSARDLRRFLVPSLVIVASIASISAHAQNGSVVTINADKAFVINGRKVFPITLSPGPPTRSRTPANDDALQELRDAGALIIRIAQTTDWTSALIAEQRAALDWCGEHGMFCMVNLRERSAFPAGDTATEAGLRSLINEFKTHPALALWKNKDEAWWGGTSAADLQRGYDVIKQEDANHPVEQTHAPRGTVADLQPYNSAADILALDIYPVSIPPGTNSLLANKEISMVGDWTQFLAQVGNGQKHLWMVEQIAWSGVTPPAKTLVFPTFRQSRFMAYQAIINGARGLMFFGGNIAATLNEQDALLGWNWTFWDDVLAPVVREIGDPSAIAAALVAPDSPLPIALVGAAAPDIEFCVREAGSYLYLIASKREGATVNATFRGLPAWVSLGEVLYELPRTVTVQGGEFTDAFAPFDVHVYRFSQTNQSPTILSSPRNRTAYRGTTVRFRVAADGTGPLTYQWKRNGVNVTDDSRISGGNSATLTLTAVKSEDAGSYEVSITGFGSVTTEPAMLTLADYASDQVPVITAQPQSRTQLAGSTATFSVGVSGNGPFGYQWRKNGVNLSNTSNVSGAHSWRLMIANISPFDAADYDVVVNGYSTVTSAPATLTVTTQIDQLLLYEPFDYSNVGDAVTNNTPANWTFGGTGANDLNVVAGNLTVPSLTASIGNSVTNGGAGLGVRRLLNSAVDHGLLYFSALFRINDLGATWNGAPSQVGALTATDNASFRAAVMVRSGTAGAYLAGIQKGGTGATPTFGATEFHPGETLFLVGKYDFTVSPNMVSLWVNPATETFGAVAEPANGALVASTGTDGFVIDRFNMRQNTTASVPAAMQWDELRVGTTWAAVTPPPLPLLNEVRRLTNGAFQLRYRNESGRSYSVHGSTNLLDWSALGSAVETAPHLFEFTDDKAPNYPRRFYQLRSP